MGLQGVCGAGFIILALVIAALQISSHHEKNSRQKTTSSKEQQLKKQLSLLSSDQCSVPPFTRPRNDTSSLSSLDI